MPPEGKILAPYGNLYLIGEDGVPFTIGEVGSLSLEESEDGTWSADVGMTEWSAEIFVTEIPWINRILYIIGARRQRKTALEKRKRRKRYVQTNGQKGPHILQARRPVL